jgi:hypothetical protein
MTQTAKPQTGDRSPPYDRFKEQLWSTCLLDPDDPEQEALELRRCYRRKNCP